MTLAHARGWLRLALVAALAALLPGAAGCRLWIWDCNADFDPAIHSLPPLAATVGVRYRYFVDASYDCWPDVCNDVVGIVLPWGATIDDYYDTVTWTPPASAADTDVRFQIATREDVCGDRAFQSWTVHVAPAAPA